MKNLTVSVIVAAAASVSFAIWQGSVAAGAFLFNTLLVYIFHEAKA